MNDENTTKSVLSFDDRPQLTPAQKARLNAMDDAAIAEAAATDPDNPILTQPELQKFQRVSEARVLRQKLRMTQALFAQTYQIPIGTLRDWEQHRTEPDTTAQTLIKVINAEPKLVANILAHDTTQQD